MFTCCWKALELFFKSFLFNLKESIPNKNMSSIDLRLQNKVHCLLTAFKTELVLISIHNDI